MEDDITLRVADEGRPDLREMVDLRRLSEGDVPAGPGISVRAMRNVHPPIDDFPEFPEFPSDDLFLHDITVRGFNLPDAAFDAIAVFFTRHVHINRNTATNPG